MKNHKAKGEKTEAIVLAELVRRDYIVLQPFGDNQRYDFVLDTQDGFKKVQCKTGRLRNGSVQFNISSVASNSKGSKARSYKGEVDYFVVYCYETNKIYLVPIDVGLKFATYEWKIYRAIFPPIVSIRLPILSSGLRRGAVSYKHFQRQISVASWVRHPDRVPDYT